MWGLPKGVRANGHTHTHTHTHTHAWIYCCNPLPSSEVRHQILVEKLLSSDDDVSFSQKEGGVSSEAGVTFALADEFVCEKLDAVVLVIDVEPSLHAVTVRVSLDAAVAEGRNHGKGVKRVQQRPTREHKYTNPNEPHTSTPKLRTQQHGWRQQRTHSKPTTPHEELKHAGTGAGTQRLRTR